LPQPRLAATASAGSSRCSSALYRLDPNPASTSPLAPQHDAFSLGPQHDPSVEVGPQNGSVATTGNPSGLVSVTVRAAAA
jgi:hypothetical protein